MGDSKRNKNKLTQKKNIKKAFILISNFNNIYLRVNSNILIYIWKLKKKYIETPIFRFEQLYFYYL